MTTIIFILQLSFKAQPGFFYGQLEGYLIK